MKKKGKREIKEGLVIALILFLSISVVLIVWATINKILNEPKFTIYKEECRNETGAKDCLCEERVVWNGLEFNCNKINESSCVYYYGQACEQKEVEENIKICVDKYGDEGDATWCVMSDAIDIRWLDENCEVSELKCNEEYPIQQIDYDGEDKFCCFHYQEIGKGICGKDLISNYSCGNYIVEVKK